MKNQAFWVKTIMSTAGCIVLLWWVDWDEVGDMLKTAHGYWLFAVFVLIHLDRSFMAYKWKILLRSSNVPVSTAAVIRAYYVSSLWSSILPSSVGPDAVRIIWLTKKVRCGATIISSVVVERVLGTLALAIVASGSFALYTIYSDMRLSISLFIIIFLLFAGSIIIVTFLFSQSVHSLFQKLITIFSFQGLSHTIGKVREAILTFKEKPGLLSLFLILSVFEQTFPIIGNFMMAKALSIDISLVWLMIGTPIVLVVSRAPISIHGWGIQEGAYAFIFSSAGVPVSEAVMMSVAGRVLLLLSSLPGAFWTVTTPRYNGIPVIAQASDPIQRE